MRVLHTLTKKYITWKESAANLEISKNSYTYIKSVFI